MPGLEMEERQVKRHTQKVGCGAKEQEPEGPMGPYWEVCYEIGDYVPLRLLAYRNSAHIAFIETGLGETRTLNQGLKRMAASRVLI